MDNTDKINQNKELITMQRCVDSVEGIVKMLHLRWLENRHQDNFDEYSHIMKTEAEKHQGVTFVKAYKRPFGFQFAVGRTLYQVTRVTFRNYCKYGHKTVGPYKPSKKK